MLVKSKVCVVIWDQEAYCEKVLVNGEEMLVDKFKYLKAMVSAKGVMEEEVTHILLGVEGKIEERWEVVKEEWHT